MKKRHCVRKISVLVHCMPIIIAFGCENGKVGNLDVGTDIISDPIDDDGVLDTTEEAELPPEVMDVPEEVEIPPGLVWVYIPEGLFEMGCSLEDSECGTSETPRHTVIVSAFKLTETEITEAQFVWVMGTSPSPFPSCLDCPAGQVEWYDAKAFCEAIGGRLPSEAEWEYAARGGTTTKYYCGDNVACLDSIAWYSANSGSSVHPVREKIANDFGLFDMLGSAWEWTEDCWHDDFSGAPSTSEPWIDYDCSSGVLRGGSWFSVEYLLRASYRTPFLTDPTLIGNPGFRCAQNIL